MRFTGIPNFAPEHFRRVRLRDPLRSKQLEKGLTQLAEEGAVQLFKPLGHSDFILGAVGVLQFDVILSRLRDEYNVDCLCEAIDYTTVRWIHCDNKITLKEFEKAAKSYLAYDAEGNLAYLAPNEWRLQDTKKQWPDIVFHATIEHNYARD